MDSCSSNKSSARRNNERKEKQEKLELEIKAQQRWQQTHGGIVSQTQRSKNGTFSALFGNDDDENTVCHRLSECCSPTSDILGLTDPFRGTKANEKNLGLSLLGARPLGNIEKVLEYRTILNGKSVELRRVTASVEGPVEHLQVVNAPTGAQVALPALIMHQSQSAIQTKSDQGEKKSRRTNGKPSKTGSRRKSGEQGPSAIPHGASEPWLDYEGPPGQHAAVWNGNAARKDKKHQKQKARFHGQEPQGQDPSSARKYVESYQSKHGKDEETSHRRQIQRLALNGSQPCLMVATPGASASADIHLHYPQSRTENTLVTMDPNIETNTAKFIPIGRGMSSNMDEFSPHIFDRSFYHSEDTANAQNLLHSTRTSPQKNMSSSYGRQQSLPRTGQQINIFHNGATHHHYFPPSEHDMPPPDEYQYQEQPPRPQSSAAIQYTQMYPNRYYPHQTHGGFDPYFHADDDIAGSQYRVSENIYDYYKKLVHILPCKSINHMFAFSLHTKIHVALVFFRIWSMHQPTNRS